MLSEVRPTTILGFKKYASKDGKSFLEKNLIVMTKFPDISLTLVKWSKFPNTDLPIISNGISLFSKQTK